MRTILSYALSIIQMDKTTNDTYMFNTSFDEGDRLGDELGFDEGVTLGDELGFDEGDTLGVTLGNELGATDGVLLGVILGVILGVTDGRALGVLLGALDGSQDEISGQSQLNGMQELQVSLQVAAIPSIAHRSVASSATTVVPFGIIPV